MTGNEDARPLVELRGGRIWELLDADGERVVIDRGLRPRGGSIRNRWRVRDEGRWRPLFAVYPLGIETPEASDGRRHLYVAMGTPARLLEGMSTFWTTAPLVAVHELADEALDRVTTAPAGQIDPAEMARAFVLRPGMYVGRPASLQTVAAWLRGFDDALAMSSGVVTAEGMEQRPTRIHAALLEPKDDERAAILALEPLAKELFTEARANAPQPNSLETA